MRMSETEIYEYARQLLDAHGDRAEVEAAQMACSCEEQGNNELAQNWRRVEKALRLMRGPRTTGSSAWRSSNPSSSVSKTPAPVIERSP